VQAKQFSTKRLSRRGQTCRGHNQKKVDFTAGVFNTFTVAAGPYVDLIMVTNGTLPSGLTLTNNGKGTATLSGTPTSTVTANLTFTASIHGGPKTYSATQKFTLNVVP